MEHKSHEQLHRELDDAKRLVNDSDYGTGWEDGIEHCTYMLDWNVI